MIISSGLKNAATQPAAPHHQADRDREGEREREADRHAAHRVEDVEQRFAVGEDRRQLAQRLVRRRQAADVEDARGELPERQQAERRRAAAGRPGMAERRALMALPRSGSSISRSMSTTYCLIAAVDQQLGAPARARQIDVDDLP